MSDITGSPEFELAPFMFEAPADPRQAFDEALHNGARSKVTAEFQIESWKHSETFQFTENYRGVKQEISGHGLFFGAVQIGKNERFGTAVKPHSSMDDVVQELEGNRILQEAEFVTYPFNLVVEGRDKVFLCSRTMLDLRSLNELEWPNLAQGRHGKNVDRRHTTIQGCARSLARLHVVGRATHGDSQIKNFAKYLRTPGLIHPIDAEKLTVQENPYDRASKAADDLLTLRDSITRRSSVNDKGRVYHGVAMWEGLSLSFKNRLFTEHIIEPYYDEIIDLGERKNLSGDPDYEVFSNSVLHNIFLQTHQDEV